MSSIVGRPVIVGGLVILSLLLAVITVSLPQQGSCGVAPRRIPAKIAPGQQSSGAVRSITFELDREIQRPAPVQFLRASRLSDGTVRLEWIHPDLLHECFNVYRKVGEEWHRVGIVKAKPEEERFFFVDRSAQMNVHYQYAVTAVNDYGNVSGLSDPAETIEAVPTDTSPL